MERRYKIIILLLLLLHSETTSQFNLSTNPTVSQFNLSTNLTGHEKLKSQHRMSGWWPYLSLIGMLGSILNSLVLYCFISERNNMVSSINVMIW